MPENDTQRTVDSDKLMDDVISDYEQRIAAIQQAKKTMGRDAAVSRYVPACKSNTGFYCLGTYTKSLNSALENNGISSRGGGLMQFTNAERGQFKSEAWGSPQISCPAAINYFETHKNRELKSCGKSLRDMPKGTTLGQMLAQGYKDGSIPKGSLVLVQSAGNTSTGMHAVMFVGLNENGEPLFSSANPEKIRQTVPKWSNQVANPSRSRDLDCYVVNMKKAMEVKLPQVQNHAEQKKQAEAQKQTQTQTPSNKPVFKGLGGGFMPKQMPVQNDSIKPHNGFKIPVSPIKNLDADFDDEPSDKKADTDNSLADMLKKAVNNVADKLGNLTATVSDKLRHAWRNEIRFRAKSRCDKKTDKLLAQKSAQRNNAASRPMNLMKTLMRQSAPLSAQRTSDRQSLSEKMQQSPALNRAIMNKMHQRA